MSEKYNCVIIDDDPMSSLFLETHIKKSDDLVLQKVFNNPVEGLEFIKDNQNVSLLFLDVAMPKLNGFDLLKSLDQRPETILTTAYKEFAVDAFDFQVSDYLVKPIDYERFQKAVERAINNIKLAGARSEEETLFVKVNKKMVKLFMDDILFIKALSDFVVIHTSEDQHIVYTTMKAFIEKLNQEKFERIHRSYIINVNKITEIKDNFVIIKDEKLPIGKSYRTEFFERIKNQN